MAAPTWHVARKSPEAGHRLDASQIKLEDRARYYGDETERWLYVTLAENA